MNEHTKNDRLKKSFLKATNSKKLQKLKNKLLKSDSYMIKKRTSYRFCKKKYNIYVNNKTDFKVYLKLCEKYFESDANEIMIHGLGAAINRACNLALHLQEIHHGTLELDIKTSSVKLIDDLEPKNDNVVYKVNERFNSAIHIRVFQIASVKSLRFEC